MPIKLRRFFLYLAFFASTLHALGMPVGYVTAAQRGVQIVEVCNAFGIERVWVDGDGQPLDPAARHADVYCEFCTSCQMPPVTAFSPLAGYAEGMEREAPAVAFIRRHTRKLWLVQVPRPPPAENMSVTT